jgi:hypothetical protein
LLGGLHDRTVKCAVLNGSRDDGNHTRSAWARSCLCLCCCSRWKDDVQGLRATRSAAWRFDAGHVPSCRSAHCRFGGESVPCQECGEDVYRGWTSCVSRPIVPGAPTRSFLPSSTVVRSGNVTEDSSCGISRGILCEGGSRRYRGPRRWLTDRHEIKRNIKWAKRHFACGSECLSAASAYWREG